MRNFFTVFMCVLMFASVAGAQTIVLDGVPVGTTNPSTGKFTNLEATTQFKLGSDTATSFDDIDNEKVKSSATDSTPGFLSDELQAGTNVTLSGTESITISVPDTLTTKGDVLYHNGTTETRLAVGDSGQILTTDTSDNLIWANPAEGDQLFNSNVLLNSYRTGENLDLSVLKMIDGAVDAFTDETGVDATASTNEEFDGTNDLYSSTAPSPTDVTSAMTSNTAPSGTASTSSTLTGNPFEIFDDGNNGWQATSTASDYVQYAFNNGLSSKTITSYSMLGIVSFPTRAPKDWTIEASNTGAFTGEEVTLDTRTGVTFNTNGDLQTFTFTNTTAYVYYRMVITANGGDTVVGLREWNLFESAIPDDMTLISESQSAEVEPNGANILLLAEDVNANITINTDIKASVSRDGGTTFTQVTLADAGEFENGNLLTGTVDLSSQPTGTDMEWKVETDNNKDLNLHGVGLEWR